MSDALPGPLDVTFGPCTLHLPDENDATFWLKHDLAGLLGVATSAEAEERFKKALRAASVREIDVDAEDDVVFVHARSATAMMAALRVLVKLAPSGAFEGADPRATDAALVAHKRQKRVS